MFIWGCRGKEDEYRPLQIIPLACSTVSHQLELTEAHVHDNCYDKLQGYRSPDKGNHAESSSKEVDGGKQKVYRNKSTGASNKHVLGAPPFD